MGDLALYLEARDQVREALLDSVTRNALSKSIQIIDSSRDQEIARWSKIRLEEMRDLARAAKKEIIDNLDRYVEKATQALERGDCEVYFANTPEEARNIVEEIVFGFQEEKKEAKTTSPKQ